ncbi:MAG: isochorismatase family protein, partial [Pseudolabrys sp.]
YSHLTVRATDRKTLIMAGVWTSVCVMFPALDANAAGFKVYAVIDASGDPSELTSRTTLARFAQGGVIPTSTNAVLSELHRTWNRPEAGELAKLYGLVAPNYAAGDGELSKGPRRQSSSEVGSCTIALFQRDVRYWHKADTASRGVNVCF